MGVSCLVLLPGTKSWGASSPAGVGGGSGSISTPCSTSDGSRGDTGPGANVGSLGGGVGNWHGLGHSHWADSWDGDGSPGNGWGSNGWGGSVADGTGSNSWGSCVGSNWCWGSDSNGGWDGLKVDVRLSWDLLVDVWLGGDLLMDILLSGDLLVHIGLSGDLLVDVGLSR